MSVPGKEAEGRRHSEGSAEIERLYESLGGVLFSGLRERYGLSMEDAESVVLDAFGAYVTNEPAVGDAQGWLILLVCAEAEKLQQIRAFEEALLDSSHDARDRELIRRALATLPENAREAVRMRRCERMSYEAVAAKLDITVPYAKHLVASSIAKVVAMRRRFRRQEQG